MAVCDGHAVSRSQNGGRHPALQQQQQQPQQSQGDDGPLAVLARCRALAAASNGCTTNSKSIQRQDIWSVKCDMSLDQGRWRQATAGTSLPYLSALPPVDRLRCHRCPRHHQYNGNGDCIPLGSERVMGRSSMCLPSVNVEQC